MQSFNLGVEEVVEPMLHLHRDNDLDHKPRPSQLHLLDHQRRYRLQPTHKTAAQNWNNASSVIIVITIRWNAKMAHSKIDRLRLGALVDVLNVFGEDTCNWSVAHVSVVAPATEITLARYVVADDERLHRTRM